MLDGLLAAGTTNNGDAIAVGGGAPRSIHY